MRDRHHETAIAKELFPHRHELGRAELPAGITAVALQVRVLAPRLDVVLLATVRAVAVDHEPQLLERVKGAIDRRRRHIGIKGATALDELGGGDVTDGLTENLQDRSTLWRPTSATLSEQLSDPLRFEKA